MRYSGANDLEWNFGAAKGLSFDRVLIFPAGTMEIYLRDGELFKEKKGENKPAFDIPKFYVALTRARHSAAIVTDFSEEEKLIEGIEKYKVKN